MENGPGEFAFEPSAAEAATAREGREAALSARLLSNRTALMKLSPDALGSGGRKLGGTT
ncbi:hypothetical protein K0T92_02320 [Paenibacillus oenotherae]|uniref:Uncharacterized protein n=1 Tax=Paenibacillus oenotherae TaxID=1435645 RepID=A0ABS7D109_9BACL|nr:hypothetical protein [Paenibacillus oenotherae]MBW7473579.1 hypothetical protein [Paenibacillus oenotherae]